MAIVKVRLKRSIYYFNLQPDGTFSKNPGIHAVGAIIPVLAKDAPGIVADGKAEYVNEIPPKTIPPAASATGAAAPAKKEETTKASKKD